MARYLDDLEERRLDEQIARLEARNREIDAQVARIAALAERAVELYGNEPLAQSGRHLHLVEEDADA